MDRQPAPASPHHPLPQHQQTPGKLKQQNTRVTARLGTKTGEKQRCRGGGGFIISPRSRTKGLEWSSTQKKEGGGGGSQSAGHQMEEEQGPSSVTTEEKDRGKTEEGKERLDTPAHPLAAPKAVEARTTDYNTQTMVVALQHRRQQQGARPYCSWRRR